MFPLSEYFNKSYTPKEEISNHGKLKLAKAGNYNRLIKKYSQVCLILSAHCSWCEELRSKLKFSLWFCIMSWSD